MRSLLICLLVIALAFTACEEIPPVIQYGNQELVLGNKNVLVEEFTGVRCANCPAATSILNTLQAGSYAGHLILVSIHNGSFAVPYPESIQDLNVGSLGDELATYLGPVVGYPAAIFNRKEMSGESNLASINSLSWASYVEEEALLNSPLDINITATYDSGAHQLNVSVNLYFNQAVSEALKLSVMVTESDIVDVQARPEGKDYGYVHQHILRMMATPSNGNLITEVTGAGASLDYSYTVDLDPLVVGKNTSVVALVHRASDKEVLQADEAHTN